MPATLNDKNGTQHSRQKPARVECEVRDISDLPDDPDVLKHTIMQLLQSVNELSASNAKLSEQLEYMLRRYQGRQSEKMDAAQLALFAEMLGEATAAAGEDDANAGDDAGEKKPPKKPRSKPSGRRPLPAHLPRVIQEHTLDPSMLGCPTCGEERVVIGQKASEQLEYVPAKLIVIRHVASTYACRSCGGEVETAPKPNGAIPKCLAAPGLLAHVIVSKFDDHIPVYRQEEIFKRNGIDINRSTMCGWLMGCAAALEPVYKLMHQRILRSRVIQTDGSTLPMMEPGRGSTRAAGFWVYRGDVSAPYVAYDFTERQDRAGPVRWLTGFSGTLQADAASLYDIFFDETKFGTRVVEAGCWAHARRYFEKAKMEHPAQALMAMAWIRKLYAIEDIAKPMSKRRRRRLRRRESRAVLREFNAWLSTIEPEALPKSKLGKAIGYVRRNWKALIRYATSGRLEIDNNASERGIKPMVIGRKNYLFAGSADGGRAAATLYAMIESAKRCRIENPAIWLADVLARVNDTPEHELADLLPDRWKLLHENDAVRQIADAAARRREFAATRPR